MTVAVTGQTTRHLLVWLKRLFALLAIGFLVYFGWQSSDLLADIVVSASVPRLAAAVCLWLCMHLLSPLFATVVFRASGLDIAYVDAARIHLLNLPARYIPGGVWHTVGRIVAFRDLGIDARRISLFVLLENSLAVAVAFLLGGGLLYLFRGAGGWGGLAAVCAAGGSLVLLLLPVVVQTWVLRGIDNMMRRHYLGSIAVVALSWCIAAGTFVLFVSSFPALSLDMAPLETAAAYLFSWGVGFLAVFAPQGIGVFEVMAGELLRGSFALGGIAALLAGFRAIIFTADLIAWLVGRFVLPPRPDYPPIINLP